MLYPKENPADRKLILRCEYCKHEEAAKEPRVNRKNYQAQVAADLEEVPVNVEVVNDPTLPRTYEEECPKCGRQEAVYFPPSPNSMDMQFICCNADCLHVWLERD